MADVFVKADFVKADAGPIQVLHALGRSHDANRAITQQIVLTSDYPDFDGVRARR